MQKIRSKLNHKIYYFQFFSEVNTEDFWYTETSEAYEFNIGQLNAFEPIGKTWDELRKENA